MSKFIRLFKLQADKGQILPPMPRLSAFVPLKIFTVRWVSPSATGRLLNSACKAFSEFPGNKSCFVLCFIGRALAVTVVLWTPGHTQQYTHLSAHITANVKKQAKVAVKCNHSSMDPLQLSVKLLRLQAGSVFSKSSKQTDVNCERLWSMQRVADINSPQHYVSLTALTVWKPKTSNPL